MRLMRAGTKTLVATAGLAVAFAGTARAEFDLNWQVDGTPLAGTGGCYQFAPDCSIIVHHDETGEVLLSDQTPFVYQKVTDVNGRTYYHMIIGAGPDEAGFDGFAQEVYIEYGGATGFVPGQATTLPASGGPNLASRLSSSGGAIDPFCFENCGPNTNAADPLGSQAVSGSATGNPNRVQMRQLLIDGDLTADFVKDRFLEKPTITNRIDAADIEATMIIDGSGSLYTPPPGEQPASSQVINTVVHRGANLPPEASATFDMADLDTQPGATPNVTAGEYTTTDPNVGLPGGPYIYADPLENVNLAPDWSSFFDHGQTNPWSFPNNRPTP